MLIVQVSTSALLNVSDSDENVELKESRPFRAAFLLELFYYRVIVKTAFDNIVGLPYEES